MAKMITRPNFRHHAGKTSSPDIAGTPCPGFTLGPVTVRRNARGIERYNLGLFEDMPETIRALLTVEKNNRRCQERSPERAF